MFRDYKDYMSFVMDVDEAELDGHTIHVTGVSRNNNVDEGVFANAKLSVSINNGK